MATWTKQQLDAINTRGRDIIVSASAGTGKTSVMIERISSLLREGYSLNRMLIVTFTNAAAIDMKDKLAKKLIGNDLKAEISAANIGTLHSWCKKLIGEYFYYTDLDPDFEMIDEGAGKKLFDDSLNAVVEEFAADPAFEVLTEVLGGRRDEGVKTAVSALYRHLIIRPEFDIKLSDSGAKDKLREIFRAKMTELLPAARRLYQEIREANFIRNAEAAFELIGCIENMTPPVIKLRGTIPADFVDLNDGYKELKAKINAVLERADEAEGSENASLGFSTLLLNMAKRLNEIFSRKKRATCAADFNDLEHFALQILQSKAGEEIRKSYDFVFVDEYQDINPLQNRIIECVKTEDRLFIVGDIKQSIYAFRGCEPQIFADKIEVSGIGYQVAGSREVETAEGTGYKIQSTGADGKILETQRLYLREMTRADYPALCAILRDKEVMYAYEHAFSDDEAQNWLDKQLKNYTDYGFGLWAVVLKSTGEMIGQCGLTMQDFNSKKVLEVGYLFQKAYWHKGYATEAAVACREYAFDKLGATEVFSIIRDTNAASARVAGRNGMTVRGRFIKHYYSIDMPHLVFSAKRAAGAVIPLNTNHRSKPKILEFINEVFCRIMSRDFGGADYAGEGRFYINEDCGREGRINDRDGGDGSINVYLYQTEEKTKNGIYDLTQDHGQKDDGVRIAALRVAELLDATLTANGETKKAVDGKKEKIEPSDIAVLVRKSGAHTSALIKKLAEMGIKAEVSESLRDFECKEVSALIEYLKLINNRFDDVALINSLKSRFGGLTDEELATVRNFRPHTEYFYQAAEGFCLAEKDEENGNPQKFDEIKGKLTDFYAKLKHFRKLAREASVEELIGAAVSGFDYFLTAFVSGEAAVSALDAFLNSIPNNNAANLTEFLEGLSVPSAPSTGSGAVKIMTVHAAKGLEFPFVILLDAQWKFNEQDLGKPLILADGLLGIKNFDMENREAVLSAEWLLNKYTLQKRRREEEMRLLYVAITRAKYGLDIIAEGNLGDAGGLTGERAEDCTSWLKWLMPVCGQYAAALPAEREFVPPPPVCRPDPIIVEALKQSFEPLPPKNELPPKTYVTALLHMDEDDGERVVYIGGADADRAAKRGTLYHKAMELLDFGADFEPQWEGLYGEIKEETDKGEIKAAFDAVGRRLTGYQIYKEQSFIADVPASIAGFKKDGTISVDGAGDAEGAILIQGIIDVLAIKDGTAVIVDYKTGAICPKYKRQLTMYAFAAQKVLGMKIEKLLIYSFKEKRLLEADKT